MFFLFRNDNLHIEQRTLSCFLMSAYAVLRLNWDVQKTNSALLENIFARLAFFRDYHGDSSYKLNILDCLRGLETGCKINNWFTSYAATKFPQATNSRLDMDWIVPRQFLALKDPTIKRERESRGVSRSILKELRRCGIKVIVRLNGNDHMTNMEYYGHSYNAIDIKQAHFYHYDIPFKDVSIPTNVQANQFVTLCERFGGEIAVHCHAGLGRTATMIGCYLIKHHGFNSRSVCGWLKICRRGSVMGPQHFYLDKYEKYLHNVSRSHEETKSVFSKVDSSTNTAQTMLKPRICRAPKKNNIIHIVPSKPRVAHTKECNPISKNKAESCNDSELYKTAVLSKAKASIQSTLKNADIKHASQNKSMTHPTVVIPRPKSNHTQSNTSRKVSPRPKKSRKQIIKSCPIRPCYINLTDINPIKSPGRAKNHPMNKQITMSHETIRPTVCSIEAGQVLGSRSWGDWGGKMIDSLFLQSKTKIYGLINNIYLKQDNSR